MSDRFFFILCFAWVALFIAGSALFRLNRCKPIFARAREGALFTERWASGGGGIGGAENCLMVSVSPTRLIVMPQFPMTLMLLPELFGLELDLAPRDIKRVIVSKRRFGTRLRIERNDGRRTFKLQLRKANDFLSAIQQIGVPIERD